MNKTIISQGRKSLSAVLKSARSALTSLGLSTATEIGIEILKIDGIYYLVKNPAPEGETQYADLTVSTSSATQRYTAGDLQEMVGK